MSIDEKLARGLARELFRRLAKLSRQETSQTTPAVAWILDKYLMEGGVEESSLMNLSSGLEAALAGAGERVETRHIRHPVKRKIILGSTAPASVEGAEQNWMVARSTNWVFQRNVLKVVESVHHVAIAQHAVFRLFQRGDMHNGFTTELLDRVTLWAPALLFSLFGLGAPGHAGDGTNVAIPFAHGLLLGTIDLNRLEGPEQGPTITDFRRGGHRMRHLKAPFQIGEDVIPVMGINTYVGRDELFANQRTILDALEKFEERYRAAMANMRRMCALGYPDAEVTKLLGPVQFNEIDAEALIELAGQVRQFFESPEWKMHSEAHRPRVRFLQ